MFKSVKKMFAILVAAITLTATTGASVMMMPTTVMAATSTTYYVTTTAGLNLRSKASTSSTKILTMPYGAKISVSSISNGWAKCTYSGKSGYCSSQYISTKNPINKTVKGAMNWCESKIGKKVGTGQCVALISEYYKYLGVSPVSGNACDYSKNALPSGWKRVKGGKPQKGDILVYTGAKYGHVVIYAGGTTVYQQNWKGKYVEKTTNWNYNKSWYSSSEGGQKSYWGYIRPAFKG